jgi:ATP-dependent RNA helicase RhlE
LSVSSFSELPLNELVQQSIINAQYTVPTPIQAECIPHAIAGRDIVGCAQTGTGKTAAFALPILHQLVEKRMPPARHCPRVLVLAPTRELAVQINDSFRMLGRGLKISSTVIYGGVGQGPQVTALQRGVDIVVATPGRLLDLMQQGHLKLSHINVLVLDEADRMFDMGFLPDLKRIVAAVPQKRQSLFFSATMPGPVAQLAESMLVNPARVTVSPVASTAGAIEQKVMHMPQGEKLPRLQHLLKNKELMQVLVFTRTKHRADAVVRKLSFSGVSAGAIHGNKSQAARQRALQEFRHGRMRVLVATDIAARGLDVTGISHVINFDMPHEPESYVHRIGRTGRAGATGIALSFCDTSERGYLRQIEKLIRQTIPHETMGASHTAPGTRPAGEGAPLDPSSDASSEMPHEHIASHRHPKRPAHAGAPRGNRPPQGSGSRSDSKGPPQHGGSRFKFAKPAGKSKRRRFGAKKPG